MYLASNLAYAGSIPKQVTELLHVSYDPTRELLREINEAFAAHWRKKYGGKVTVLQSHGASGSQARAIAEGLRADVASLAFPLDMEFLVQKKLLRPDWRSQLPRESSPFSSTVVFLVRSGNPKQIFDWRDLARSDVTVVTANPKTSGGARWNYLAAWGSELIRSGGDEASARNLVRAIYKNVRILDTAARGSTTTFAARGHGDVLITWESEAHLVQREFGAGAFEIVLPPRSIKAEPVFAVIDRTVDVKGSRQAAEEYVRFFYTVAGQRLAAKHYFRSAFSSEATLASLELFTLGAVFGDAAATQQRHFSDDGIFDQLLSSGSLKG
ncbi:MAG: sulfate ABC transporter substrate-binding protein [Deltaproteobacteria bacterium]|nr:sulfate ABC transporter substrate-binding protein [Deltaproteobacteria bacterium]